MSDRIAVLRNGIFEQIGSAQDIYSRPETSYVARFVGNANVLKDKDGCLAIRAEHVEFNTPPGEGLTGRVVSRSFTGGQVRITAALENGEEITSCRQGMTSDLRSGMEIRARWAPENAIPVKDTD